jgi:hypothetical protein
MVRNYYYKRKYILYLPNTQQMQKIIQTHYFSDNLVAPGIEPGTSDSLLPVLGREP